MMGGAMAEMMAAAAKKKANYKPPVVKEHKITKEQYDQIQKDKEAAQKKKSRPLFQPMDLDDPSSGGGGDAGGGGGGGAAVPVSEAVSAIMQQFQIEKAGLTREMNELKGRMVRDVSQLRADVDELKTTVQNLEAENRTLKQSQAVSLRAELSKREIAVDQKTVDEKLRNYVDELARKLAHLEKNGMNANLNSDADSYNKEEEQIHTQRLARASSRTLERGNSSCAVLRAKSTPPKTKSERSTRSTSISPPKATRSFSKGRVRSDSPMPPRPTGPPVLEPHNAKKISKHQCKCIVLELVIFARQINASSNIIQISF
jgi:hypothetical protein